MRWIRRYPTQHPPALRNHAMVFDSARGRVVLFGGEDNFRYRGQTWEWDGVEWWLMDTPTAPAARSRHAMAYDNRRKLTVLVGGVHRDDTWEWDGTTWVQRQPTTTPGRRHAHAMAYDDGRGRVVLFGGGTDTRVWEWDGTSWSSSVPPGPIPAARVSHAMAYDPVRERVVMFGGGLSWQSTPTFRGTWEWDGKEWSSPRPVAAPEARVEHAMAFHAALGRVVVVGGHEVHRRLGEMWSWDGVAWQRGRLAAPPPREHPAMIGDPGRGTVLLFGGMDSNASPPLLYGDTWEWADGSWRVLRPLSSPSARVLHRMCFDESRGEAVMFGGTTQRITAETWTFRNGTWTQRRPSQSPLARWGFAMAYDAARQEVVLFGGMVSGPRYFQDTWTWDGAS